MAKAKRPAAATCRVTSPTGLNLRSGADKTARALAVMPCGATPELLAVGKARQAGWLQVRWQGDEGWCMAEYMEVNGNVDAQ